MRSFRRKLIFNLSSAIRGTSMSMHNINTFIRNWTSDLRLYGSGLYHYSILNSSFETAVNIGERLVIYIKLTEIIFIAMYRARSLILFLLRSNALFWHFFPILVSPLFAATSGVVAALALSAVFISWSIITFFVVSFIHILRIVFICLVFAWGDRVKYRKN